MKRYIKSTNTELNPDLVIELVVPPETIEAGEDQPVEKKERRLSKRQIFAKLMRYILTRLKRTSKLKHIGHHRSTKRPNQQPTRPKSLSTYIDCLYSEGKRSCRKSILVMLRVSDHDETKPYRSDKSAEDLEERIDKRLKYNEDKFANYSTKAPQIKTYEYTQIIVNNKVAPNYEEGLKMIEAELDRLEEDAIARLHMLDDED